MGEYVCNLFSSRDGSSLEQIISHLHPRPLHRRMWVLYCTVFSISPVLIDVFAVRTCAIWRMKKIVIIPLFSIYVAGFIHTFISYFQMLNKSKCRSRRKVMFSEDHIQLTSWILLVIVLRPLNGCLSNIPDPNVWIDFALLAAYDAGTFTHSVGLLHSKAWNV